MGRPFVVLAALPEEADAVLRLMHSRPMDATPPTFRVCRHIHLRDHDPHQRYPGILAQFEGAGRMYAAVATAYAITAWDPQFLLIVGTAGGFESQSVRLGDIIVATEVFDYEFQRLGEGQPVIRWVKSHPDEGLLKLARKVASSHAPLLKDALGTSPRVRFGPVLSGDKVIASQDAIERLLSFNNTALGVEMEGAGVAFAARQQLRPVPFLMVRGVADYADERKHEHSRHWSKAACESVARFIVVLLKSWAQQAEEAKADRK
ncbi:MAG: hypothetical protein ACJ8AT_39290 [Hyalangium sp.]|uniref:5'-methylthioadenosine/S-adenosylhomocysteine nucleosidase family protein n=1 Tax=Hyalangium sp. TaxID=2028555 RepID=UPI00389A36F2